MDSPPDPSQNAKTKLPWNLVHPENFHPDQPHVTATSIIQYHWNRQSIFVIKRFLQCVDLILVTFTLTFFIVMPMLARIIIRRPSKITIREFYCLMLSAYYKRNFIKDGNTDIRL